MALLAQMKRLSLKTQQRFPVFGTCFDVSNIIISHYEYIVKIYKNVPKTEKCCCVVKDKNYLEITKNFLTLDLKNVGGAVASWLPRLTLERALRVRALAGDIVLCS